HTLQDDFPVVRGSDLVGTISRSRIVEALRREGNGYVQGFMNRVTDVAQPNDSLATAFRKITRRGLTLIPVVERERLVGIVTLQNLTRSIGLLAETRKLKRESDE
ncbi:MAG TPA: CBS domain-containing protein, partial [Terriglobales bacterium]